MKKNEPCRMEFSLDEEGKEILLKDGKFQVMMEWEKPYMEACIDALKPSGDVLEVGFGCGYSSTHIQKYHPKSHTIIEFHPEIAKKAREWAKKYSHVTIVEDTWQNAMKDLKTFDTVFFDDYPLESEEEMQRLEKDKKQYSALVQEGNKKIQEIENSFTFLKEIRYTDEDIEFFFKELDREHLSDGKIFLRFFFDFEKKGQITKQQLEKILERLEKEKLVSAKERKEFSVQASLSPFEFRMAGDRLFEFLEQCLKNHMKKGSRFSCYLNDPTSKFEDKKFFEKIITNPFLEYSETLIPIKVPKNCEYYKADKALVIVITKLEDFK